MENAIRRLMGQEADQPLPGPDMEPPGEDMYDVDDDGVDPAVADDSGLPPFTGEDMEDFDDPRKRGPHTPTV